MTSLVRIPRRFFDDHAERDLDTPAVVRSTKTHYWIDRSDPATPELMDDARFYADMTGMMDRECFGLCRSAAATLRALRS